MGGMPKVVTRVLVAVAVCASMTGCSFVVSPACGCTTPPAVDPNWTPPAVSADQAAIYAARFAELPNMEAGLISPDTGSVYLATATDAVALVDPNTGSVQRMLRADLMPNDETVSVGEAAARSSGEAFMARVGLTTSGLAMTTGVVRAAGVAAYRVDWLDDVGHHEFVVLVNGSTSAVFAYTDLRVVVAPAFPIVGRERAKALAIAALGVPGETATSAEFAVDGQRWIWQLGMGVPSAADPEVFEHGAYVTVDAATGEVTIVKDAR